MKKEDRTKNLYRIIGEETLTTKGLKEQGFNQHDLTSLVKDGVLSRVQEKRGTYTFIDIEGLFNYGKELALNKEKEEAERILKKCLTLNPTHGGAAFELFILALQAKNYELAFHYFDICYETDNERYKKDYKIYLFLLSNICAIPEKYKAILEAINFQSVKVNEEDERFPDIKFENKIRSAIFRRRFELAQKMIYQKKERNSVDYVNALLIKEIRKKEKDNQKLSWQDIKNLIINKQYERIATYFEEQAKTRVLSSEEFLWSVLCKAYLTIKNTRNIPVAKGPKSINFFTSIEQEDYEQAKLLSEKFIKLKRQNKENNLTYIILSDINGLIAEIKTMNKTQLSNGSNLNAEVTVDTIYHLLLSGDTESAFKALRAFLERNNLVRFESFIVSLIKLSIKEKDFTFVRPIQNLVLLTSDYQFDITRYKKYFYEALSTDIEEAGLYLRIILNLKEQQNIEINVEPLQEAYSAAFRR